MTQSLAAPLRVLVFETRLAPGRRYAKYTELRHVSAGFVAWQALNAHEPARLPGSGSFLFVGYLRALERARIELRRPAVCQVSIRTNQDRQIYRYFKSADGRIFGYAEED